MLFLVTIWCCLPACTSAWLSWALPTKWCWKNNCKKNAVGHFCTSVGCMLLLLVWQIPNVTITLLLPYYRSLSKFSSHGQKGDDSKVTLFSPLVMMCLIHWTSSNGFSYFITRFIGSWKSSRTPGRCTVCSGSHVQTAGADQRSADICDIISSGCRTVCRCRRYGQHQRRNSVTAQQPPTDGGD